MYLRSGVKQGDICSPWLFNVYINDLIIRLENSRLGCDVFGEYTGCIVYADDNALLSASVRQLQVMLLICSHYALDNELIFNNTKSYSMGFGKGVDLTNLPQLFVSGKPIGWVQQCKYLGVKIQASDVFKTDVEGKKRVFIIIASVNNVITNGSFLSEECIKEIIVKQCLPILTYANWSLNAECKH